MSRTLLVALLLASSPAAAAELASEQWRPSRQHARVLLAPRNTPTATLHVELRAGAYDDGYRSGLTVLAQQAMLAANAVDRYEDFTLDLYAAGGTLELETGVRECSFTLTAPRAEFTALAKRLLTMTLAPRIVEGGIEEAKSRALQSNESASLGVLASVLARTVFNEEGWGNDPQGDKDQIRNMTADDVREHITAVMSPANATVVLAGAFDVRAMKAHLARFKGGRARPVVRPKGELAGDYHQRSYLEMHVLALPVTLESPRSVAAAHLLGAVLEERVLRRFRKLGIAYASAASPVHREWLDAVLVVLPIRGDGETSVNSHLARELAEVRGGSFIGDELERNRSHLLVQFREIDRDSALLAGALAMGAGDLEWFGPKVAAEVAALSKEDFLTTVAPWLDPAASIHVQLSPRSAASQGKGGR